MKRETSETGEEGCKNLEKKRALEAISANPAVLVEGFRQRERGGYPWESRELDLAEAIKPRNPE